MKTAGCSKLVPARMFDPWLNSDCVSSRLDVLGHSVLRCGSNITLGVCETSPGQFLLQSPEDKTLVVSLPIGVTLPGRLNNKYLEEILTWLCVALCFGDNC